MGFTQKYQNLLKHQAREEDPNEKKLLHSIEWLHKDGDLSSYKEKNTCLIYGYADDRGVAANRGRTGASGGPQSFRQQFYNLAYSAKNDLILADLGDLNLTASLKEDQEKALHFFKTNSHYFKRKLSIGGGHDWAYPDFACIDPKESLVVNFDAHLDMRPPSKDSNNSWHSGTAFRLLAEKFNKELSLLSIGLQKHCNQENHLKWGQEQCDLHSLFLEDFPLSIEKQWEELHSITNKGLRDKKDIALSLCLDAFSQSECPGVSAPQAIGISTLLVFKFIKHFKEKIKHLGIYELNPKYDQDNQSARLAAKLAHSWL